jgi:hypothetical protein
MDPADSQASGIHGQYNTITIVVGSFELDSIFLTGDSILTQNFGIKF